MKIEVAKKYWTIDKKQICSSQEDGVAPVNISCDHFDLVEEYFESSIIACEGCLPLSSIDKFSDTYLYNGEESCWEDTILVRITLEQLSRPKI